MESIFTFSQSKYIYVNIIVKQMIWESPFRFFISEEMSESKSVGVIESEKKE